MYIDYDFPNWNKYINAERTNKYIANSMKQQEKKIVKMLCRNMKPIERYPVTIVVTKYVKTKNTDVDNIRIKGLLDGLVEMGILQNDNLRYINKVILQAEVSKEKEGLKFEIIEE
jgi:hypothetical protein